MNENHRECFTLDPFRFGVLFARLRHRLSSFVNGCLSFSYSLGFLSAHSSCLVCVILARKCARVCLNSFFFSKYVLHCSCAYNAAVAGVVVVDTAVFCV